MNMSKITHLQRSFRWQPHFLFMPVYLASHPWAEHYNFKYDTLPIVQVRPNAWSLEKNMKDSCGVFLGSHKCDRDIHSSFPTEKQARGYFWYYCTMIFSLFAQFSSAISFRPNWIAQVQQMFCQKNLQPVGTDWLQKVDSVLGDFKYTQKAGVVINVGTMELWPYIKQYHDACIPVLMHTGHCIFSKGFNKKD